MERERNEKLLYLSLSNTELKVVTPQTAAEEIREESKPSGPAEATIMSDNDLLLDLGPNTSGDEDVDYAAPRTSSYCPPAETKEHMTEDEQSDAYGHRRNTFLKVRYSILLVSVIALKNSKHR